MSQSASHVARVNWMQCNRNSIILIISWFNEVYPKFVILKIKILRSTAIETFQGIFKVSGLFRSWLFGILCILKTSKDIFYIVLSWRKDWIHLKIRFLFYVQIFGHCVSFESYDFSIVLVNYIPTFYGFVDVTKKMEHLEI